MTRAGGHGQSLKEEVANTVGLNPLMEVLIAVTNP